MNEEIQEESGISRLCSGTWNSIYSKRRNTAGINECDKEKDMG